MSLEAMKWAKKVMVGKSTAKAVLIALADIHHAENNSCYASEANLVEFTEQNWKTIKKGIQYLVEVGIITPKTRTGQAPNYRLHIGETPSKIGGGKAGNCGNLRQGTPSKFGGGKETGTPSKFSGTPLQIFPEPPPNLEDKQVNRLNESDKLSGEDMRLARWMLDRVLLIAPKTKTPNLDKWANTIRLMRERDGREHREIESLFKFANEHRFWAANIRSPEKLRDQFATLDAQQRQAANGPNQPSEQRRRLAI
ncbi:hypothetical protein CWI75_10735 [Kineobactrum sediminis]|uniref:Helix-turn-helix domain-containing protein n=1 Tax=Kineobactrum sediminis TaxID=1905677 RepID=A0A2N5Y1I0_9GAMM|nr:helix-turn-helix domain-containing protein [Kineobactrum sediminis]PLW82246.1 hypothetical protein CWI75_10735 [Kineobactrum sediminis]